MADVWGDRWLDTWGASWKEAASPPVITDVSSLSLVNISGLSAGDRLGTEELDAIYVGKGKRP